MQQIYKNNETKIDNLQKQLNETDVNLQNKINANNANNQKELNNINVRIEKLQNDLTKLEGKQEDAMEVEKYQNISQNFELLFSKLEIEMKQESNKKKGELQNTKNKCIDTSDKKNANENTQTLSDKIKEDINKLKNEMKSEHKLYQAQLKKESEEFKNWWKSTKEKEMEIENTKCKEAIEKEIRNLEARQAQTKKNEKEQGEDEVKQLKETAFDLECKVGAMSDDINTQIVPFMVNTYRTAEYLTRRIEGIWKYRGTNKYLKGEEKRGFGINTEVLKRELERKHPEYKDQTLKMTPANDPSYEGNIELHFLNKAKGMKFNEIEKPFREAYFCEIPGKTGYVKIYIPKDQRNTPSEDKRNHPAQREGEMSGETHDPISLKQI